MFNVFDTIEVLIPSVSILPGIWWLSRPTKQQLAYSVVEDFSCTWDVVECGCG